MDEKNINLIRGLYYQQASARTSHQNEPHRLLEVFWCYTSEKTDNYTYTLTSSLLSVLVDAIILIQKRYYSLQFLQRNMRLLSTPYQVDSSLSQAGSDVVL